MRGTGTGPRLSGTNWGHLVNVAAPAAWTPHATAARRLPPPRLVRGKRTARGFSAAALGLPASFMSPRRSAAW